MMQQTQTQAQPPQGGFLSPQEGGKTPPQDGGNIPPNAPQMDPALKEAFQKVVMAGLKIMYAPQTRETLASSLSQDQPIADVVASNVAGLMRIMDDKSGGKIPRQVIIPAAVVLMQDLFKFVAESGIAQPTEDDATQALQKLVVTLAQTYHVMSKQPEQSGPQMNTQPAPTGLMGAQA
ncbi:MAG: hypothetical protein IPM06_18905 [Rhizobiales bacterium]|nr:hypothetical protein [Hyphomicrobiales bacterium]